MTPGMPSALGGSGRSTCQPVTVGRDRPQRRRLGGAGGVQIDAVETFVKLLFGISLIILTRLLEIAEATGETNFSEIISDILFEILLLNF